MSKDVFAVIQLGGKQHLLKEGDIFEINSISDETKNFDINEVLLIQNGDKTIVGTPFVKDATMSIEVIEQTKGPKVVKQIYKAKARYRRKVGHRQPMTRLKVTKISVK